VPTVLTPSRTEGFSGDVRAANLLDVFPATDRGASSMKTVDRSGFRASHRSHGPQETYS